LLKDGGSSGCRLLLLLLLLLLPLSMIGSF
jgi:hypothetical protein